jgi:hypothetical protein
MADLMWGTANAKTVTISFWIRSSLTGTFSAYVFNSGYSYCFPFTFSIPSANTWVQITQTIVGPTSGTWLTTNGIGLEFGVTLLNGTNFQAASGAWTTTAYAIGVSGSVNLLGTNGATMYLTGVQLEVGSSATGFDYRSIGTELALCQRYYYGNATSTDTIFGYLNGSNLVGASSFPQPMRTPPTVTIYSNSTINSVAMVGGSVVTVSGVGGVTTTRFRTINSSNFGSGSPYPWGEFNFTANAEL